MTGLSLWCRNMISLAVECLGLCLTLSGLRLCLEAMVLSESCDVPILQMAKQRLGEGEWLGPRCGTWDLWSGCLLTRPALFPLSHVPLPTSRGGAHTVTLSHGATGFLVETVD